MTTPTLAERARTVLARERIGTLATLEPATFLPHVTAVAFVADPKGHPVLVIPTVDLHTGHAWREPRAGMAVGPVSVRGLLEAVPGHHQLDLQPRYLAAHPGTAAVVERLDHAWFRLAVEAARYDDGTRAGWIDPDDLATAEPDPVAAAGTGPEALADLTDDLLPLVRVLTSRPHARRAAVVGVDRYGCDLTVELPGGRVPARLPFPSRLDRPGEVRRTVLRMIADTVAQATAAAGRC